MKKNYKARYRYLKGVATSTTVMALLFALLLSLASCKSEAKREGNMMSDSARFNDTTRMQNNPPVTGGETSTEGAIVNVTLSEYKIDMPSTVAAGPTNFVVKNTGTAAHNFEIEGNGKEEKFPTDLMGGEIRTLHIDLLPGTYQVYCPVRDHKDHGMKMQLTVK
jgi:uncharacterized cupredoxin-like copper-binding protein